MRVIWRLQTVLITEYFYEELHKALTSCGGQIFDRVAGAITSCCCYCKLAPKQTCTGVLEATVDHIKYPLNSTTATKRNTVVLHLMSVLREVIAVLEDSDVRGKE